MIIGGSFLGAETATAVKKGFPDKNVTIIDIEEHPLKAALGLEVS